MYKAVKRKVKVEMAMPSQRRTLGIRHDRTHRDALSGLKKPHEVKCTWAIGRESRSNHGNQNIVVAEMPYRM
jgi:hypothetical protein